MSIEISLRSGIRNSTDAELEKIASKMTMHYLNRTAVIHENDPEIH